MNTTLLDQIATRIREADERGPLIGPIRDELPDQDLDTAYQIQLRNTKHHVENGRVICGRKIGLTSPAVQKQLGVDEPDFGILYKDMEFSDGDTIPWTRLHQPKVEAEIALVLKEDLPSDPIEQPQLESRLDCAIAALEVVGSRIANWDIRITDTIADNASSGVYVLGKERVLPANVDFRLCGMSLMHRGEPASTGCGAACLGSPLIAATWLANKMAEYNLPLKAGDVILTGALGPMVAVEAGESYSATINGVGTVSTIISAE